MFSPWPFSSLNAMYTSKKTLVILLAMLAASAMVPDKYWTNVLTLKKNFFNCHYLLHLNLLNIQEKNALYADDIDDDDVKGIKRNQD